MAMKADVRFLSFSQNIYAFFSSFQSKYNDKDKVQKNKGEILVELKVCPVFRHFEWRECETGELCAYFGV